MTIFSFRRRPFHTGFLIHCARADLPLYDKRQKVGLRVFGGRNAQFPLDIVLGLGAWLYERMTSFTRANAVSVLGFRSCPHAGCRSTANLAAPSSLETMAMIALSSMSAGPIGGMV